MIEKSDRKELQRRLEQAKRAAALGNDPVTTERLQKLVKELEEHFACRRGPFNIGQAMISSHAALVPDRLGGKSIATEELHLGKLSYRLELEDPAETPPQWYDGTTGCSILNIEMELVCVFRVNQVVHVGGMP